MLRRAAEVAHKSLTDFILDSACQAAEQTLLDQRLFLVSSSLSDFRRCPNKTLSRIKLRRSPLAGDVTCRNCVIRWKPLAEQPLGWQPDINDGVRLNIRPFMHARDLGKKGAGILRAKPNIKSGDQVRIVSAELSGRHGRSGSPGGSGAAAA